MKDINIAVIGWGFMGRMHTYALRAIPLMYRNLSFRPVLKCLCSAHLENALEGQKAAGFQDVTDDWKTLLNRSDVDAVSVCTPNALHEEMVTALIRAGKHLYIDKPLTTNYESALRIKQLADRSNVRIQMVMNNRFLPAVIRAGELKDAGALGNILSFSCRYLHSGSVDANKPIGWKQGKQGGVILDLASHALDLAFDICGYPESLSCAANRLYKARPLRGGGVTEELSEDHALITMRLKNGALGSCEASKIATGTNDELSFEIYADRGSLRFNLMEPGWLYYFDNTLPEAPYGGMRGFKQIECMARYPFPAGSFLPPKNAIGWDRGHIHCYYSFLDCVANDKQPRPSLDEGVKLQAVMDAALRSAETGQWIKPVYP
ncbi:MAG: Gfo/Idh/MocA family oxidoreductase [Clostridia bacterium]|nr:Gfo/Idh/MocA family oxidoreductase [Clostridia bacterium]